MQSYKFEIFADYFQFYLQDETLGADLGDSWTEEALNDLLVVTPEMIAVGTARNMTVPVEIVIASTVLDEDIALYDKVNECSLNLPTGQLVISGGSDYFPDAPRIAVTPGTYRARIYYKNLSKLSENELEGEDSYKVVLWPHATFAPVKRLKL